MRTLARLAAGILAIAGILVVGYGIALLSVYILIILWSH